MCTKIENAVVHKYGLEHKVTLAVFRLTEIIRRLGLCKK